MEALFKQLKQIFKADMNLLDTTKLQAPVYGENEDYEALLCDNGELSTTIELHGYSSIISSSESMQNIQYIVDQLSNFFASEDSRLIVSFVNDPDDHSYFDLAVNYYDKCADRLNLNVHDIHRQDAETLKRITRSDRMLLTIETGEGVLDVLNAKEANIERNRHVVKILNQIGFQGDMKTTLKQKHYGQNPLSFNRAVMRYHQDTLKSVIATLNAINGFKFHVHTAKETLQFYRSILNRHATREWSPVTYDSKGEQVVNLMQMRIDESADKNSLSGYLLPPLLTQIIGDDMRLDEQGIMSFNGFHYQSMSVEVPQNILTSFKSLLNKTLHLPYLINWHLTASTKAVNALLARASMIGMAGIIPGPNNCNRIKDDGAVIEAVRKRESEPLAIYRLSILTWHQDKEVLRTQSSNLRKMIEDWGTQSLKIEKAMPHQSMMESLPSIAEPMIHKGMACCVYDAFVQMPWQRFRSPWSDGLINFINAEDYSVYPFDPGEKQKSFPRVIAIGPPGTGKTFLNASVLHATLFREPYRQLPLTGVVTIGYDGQLFANSIRDALPEDKKHLVFYDEPQLNEEFAVNIFDLPYGARHPSNAQRASIVNFMDQCAADLGQSSFGRDFSSLLDEIVIEAYQYFSDQSDHPKLWTQGMDNEVDSALLQAGFDYHKLRNYNWWELFDHFHDKGDFRMAYRCQQQAMPTIKELPDVLSESKSIIDSARKIKSGQGVALLDIFINKIKLICTKYPNAVITTRYNIEGARIHILDLQYVCGKQDDDKSSEETEEERQASVMYMLYVNIFRNKFNIHKNMQAFKSDLSIDEKYHAYHEKLIKAEAGIPKIVRVYEKHRSKKAKNFNKDLSRDVREGRKYGYDFGGDSQLLEDWDIALVRQMGCVFISSMGESEDEQNTYRKYLGFNETHFTLAKRHLRGRHDKYGQPFLLVVQDIDGESGRFIVPVYYLASTNKLWAFKTDEVDYIFKQRLEEKLTGISKQPVHHARLILSNQFPSSSIQRSRERLISSGEAGDNDQADDILLKNCINAYYELIDTELPA
ncbi:hypothetical protein [Cysteiniphilum litorale]|uniref:hypothetical protein n=1 Tax=Cysteiniphilum litorale TaxID=2056700 RepID=UPI003F88288F